MLILSAPALLNLQSALVTAAHGLVRLDGSRAQISTIDPKALRMAAIMAVQIAAGESVLPGDETIDISVPDRRDYGVFRIGR